MAFGGRPWRSKSESADDVTGAEAVDCGTSVAVAASESVRIEIGRKRIGSGTVMGERLMAPVAINPFTSISCDRLTPSERETGLPGKFRYSLSRKSGWVKTLDSIALRKFCHDPSKDWAQCD